MTTTLSNPGKAFEDFGPFIHAVPLQGKMPDMPKATALSNAAKAGAKQSSALKM